MKKEGEIKRGGSSDRTESCDPDDVVVWSLERIRSNMKILEVVKRLETKSKDLYYIFFDSHQEAPDKDDYGLVCWTKENTRRPKLPRSKGKHLCFTFYLRKIKIIKNVSNRLQKIKNKRNTKIVN